MKKGIFLSGIVLILIVQFSYNPSFFNITETPAPTPSAVHDSEYFDDFPDYGYLYPNDEVTDYCDHGTTFNSSGTDTFVFLHMQKTGGTTLGRRFVEDIVHLKCKKIKNKKRSFCPRPLAINSRDSQPALPSTWIFSRYSTGWACGLHADWTELQACVPEKLNQLNGNKKRNLIYITNLRNATLRFISEWKHVQRGATWHDVRLNCGGEEHPYLWNKCFPDEADWTNVTLLEFTNCPFNLAFNRQTRMLADLELVECYNYFQTFNNLTDDIERKLLESAKLNLSKMRWFGLVEYQLASEILFEHAFQPLHFGSPFTKWNVTHSSEALMDIPDDLLQRVTEMNHLDAALYEFAKDLFFQRYKNLH